MDSYDLSGSTVVLTGASGLLGTHILSVLGQLERLKRGPEKVFAYSRNNDPVFVEPLPKCMVSIKQDLTDRSMPFKLPSVDFIIHAAGYGQPRKFMERPISTIDLNTRVTAELIDHLNPSGRFLFVSTSEIYSGLDNPPFKETQVGTTNTDHFRAPYIEGKRCGEAICIAALGGSNRCTAARVALAYGPGVFHGDDRVLYSFIRQAVENRNIKVGDTGLARRTYCYVTDTVEMLMKLLLQKDLSGIFNVGGVSHTSIRELAILVGELSKCNVQFADQESASLGASLVSLSQVDTTKIDQILGKRDYVSLTEGIARTLKWWRGCL
jgi:UDP-glucuronate decarboxylase